MDANGKNCEGDKAKPSNDLDTVKVANKALNGERDDDDDEAKTLLLPKKGALYKKGSKPRMKVQWNDRNGDKLAEVLEFEPSDESDSDDEESDSCICRIM